MALRFSSWSVGSSFITASQKNVGGMLPYSDFIPGATGQGPVGLPIQGIRGLLLLVLDITIQIVILRIVTIH